MLVQLIPVLLAIPLALAASLTLPAVQRVLLPPPQALQELIAEAQSRPEPEPPVRWDVTYHQDLLRNYRLDVYGPLTESAAEDPDGAEDTDGAENDPARLNSNSISSVSTDATLSAPAPVIVFFHGGSWIRGDKITLLVVDRFLRRMREAGWFVVSVNYTTSAFRGIGGPVRNAYRALEWVHEHADSYGWDPHRVGVYGVSSGAHLALMAASPASGIEPRPVLVLSECAPADLIAMSRGDGFDNSSTFRLFPNFRLRALSPTEHIDSDYPPVLIYHGDADEIVAFDQAEVLAATLSREGVSHELVRYPGGNHAFLNYSDKQWYELESRAIRWMRSIFDNGTPAPPATPPAELPLFTRQSDSP